LFLPWHRLKSICALVFGKERKLLPDDGILDASENTDIGDVFEFQLYQSKRVFGLDFIREE
tara:strand:+ start:4773 stop:4955 length:183 start_codon:yes stop_codon:yes gene_type:complete